MNMDRPVAAAEVVSILAQYAPEAREKLRKLAKRATRYGQEITWTETKRTETFRRARWDGKPIDVRVDYVDLAITGSAPRAGDFRFIAKLETEEGGVLISAVPGEEVGELGRAWDGRCDHCGRNRRRVLGFIVEDANGRKVVGRSCLRDHLGMDEPAGLMAAFSTYRDILGMGEDEDGGGWGGRGRWQESTLGVIAASRAAIALWGWRPATSEGRATRDYVNLLWERIEPKDRVNQENRARLLAELTERGDHYQETAEAVLAWGRALKPRGDYEHNLAVALAGENVTLKTFGLAVSAAAAYDRTVAVAEKRKAEQAALPPSYHFGKIGERLSAIVTVERIVGLPDYGFGPSRLFIFREEKGALVTWKTSTSTDTCIDRQPIEVGTRCKATFTVKDHKDYQGSPETRVSRVKLAAEGAAK